MNIYLKPPEHESRGLRRIADALARYKPAGSEVVDNEREADLVILYAIGRQEALARQAHEIKKRGSKYAVLQLCLRSTQKPLTQYWLVFWSNATAVWSYYDLKQAVRDDADSNGDYGSYNLFDELVNFYHAPLGVDAEVFADKVTKTGSRSMWYIVATSGLSRLSESVRECALAAKQVGLPVFHLGAHLSFAGNLRVDCCNDISDDELAAAYSNCQFVSGLRRTEGFELPAAEGLLCGARPILFDTADYRWNYRDHGEYIPEGTRDEVVESLVELFRRGPRPVTAEELQRAAEWFNWERVVGGFYERCQ